MKSMGTAVLASVELRGIVPLRNNVRGHPMKKHFPPAEVTEEEWAKMEAALATSALVDVVKKMRALNNVPQKACDIFPPHQSSYGHELVNTILRKGKLSFRFTRTEPQKREHRPERMLAFVRWGDAEQAP